MQFGITFKGEGSPERTRYLVRQAEEAGFAYSWFFDSHILWRDSYVTIAMCIEHTPVSYTHLTLPTICSV